MKNNVSLFDDYFIEKFKDYFKDECGLDNYTDYIYKKLINKKDMISSATIDSSNIIKTSLMMGYSCRECLDELKLYVFPKYGDKLDKFRFSVIATMLRDYLGDEFIIPQDEICNANTVVIKAEKVYIRIK